MTARDDYPSHEQTFADADAKLELAKALLDRALPVTEGDPAWWYLVKSRKLPATAVRAALPELRLVEPLIEGRPATDYGIASLLRDAGGAVTGLQLTFVNITGTPSATAPRRQSYALRQHGVRDALSGPLGPAGEVAYLVEGRLEKVVALAAAGLGPVYGGGGRKILGFAVPKERQIVLVADRRPDGEDAGGGHDKDYKSACDRLYIAGCAVSLTPDPPACAHHCKDADDVLVKHGPIILDEWISRAEPIGSLSLDGEALRLSKIDNPLERDAAVTAAAKRLKVRVGMLREAVRAHHDRAKGRSGGAAEDEDMAPGRAMVFDELHPAAEPQDGAQLFNDVGAAIDRHVTLAPADRVKCVLWTVHGHRRFHGNLAVLPRLIITAEHEDSGKSTLARTIRHLSDVAEYTISPTPANIFRPVEEHNCAFILDEADLWWARSEGIRDIINSGFTSEESSVLRCEDVGTGTKRVLQSRRYSTFTPIAIVGIKLDKVLPRTLLSRSLVVRLRPALVGEVFEELSGNRPAVARLRTLAGRITDLGQFGLQKC
jgi:hypothetical protein